MGVITTMISLVCDRIDGWMAAVGPYIILLEVRSLFLVFFVFSDNQPFGGTFTKSALDILFVNVTIMSLLIYFKNFLRN